MEVKQGEIQVNTTPYARGLDKNEANFVALTPLSFLERAASIYPDRTAIVHGDVRRTWDQTLTRCRQLGAALRNAGIGPDDTVSVMAANTPELFEAHFGVAMSGG
ncbi:MAG: AMP-binding protein, partial [Magnetovibrio sp.]|nr:AMP-binding protein [Magnetovibrio sp.]